MERKTHIVISRVVGEDNELGFLELLIITLSFAKLTSSFAKLRYLAGGYLPFSL